MWSPLPLLALLAPLAAALPVTPGVEAGEHPQPAIADPADAPASERAARAALARAQASGDNLETIEALIRLGRAVHLQSRFAEAEPYQLRAVALLRGLPAPPRQLLATALFNLAETLRAQDRAAQAEPLAREALALRDHAFPLDIADSQMQLATILIVLNRPAEAEALARQALSNRSGQIGADHARTINARAAVAEALKLQQKYREAEPIARAVLSARIAAGDLAEIGNAAQELADLLRRMGRAGEAEPHQRRALEIAEADQDPGAVHYREIRRLDLAVLLVSEKRYSEALPLFTLALAKVDQGTAADARQWRWYLYFQAYALDMMGRDVEAHPVYRRVLAAEEADLGPEHPDLAVTLDALAMSLVDRRQNADALPLMQRAVAIRETALPATPELATALEDLALVVDNLALESVGSFGQAEALLRRAIAIREAAPRDELRMARAAAGLARVLMHMDRFAEAIAAQRRAIALFTGAGGADADATLRARSDLARWLGAAGRFKEAEVEHRGVIAGREAGGDASATADAFIEFVAFLLRRARYAEAVTFARHAVAVLEHAGAGDSNAAADALSMLGDALASSGDLAEGERYLRRAMILRARVLPPGSRSIGADKSGLADILRRQGRYAEAEALLRDAETLWRTYWSRFHADIGLLMQRRAELSAAAGRSDAADALYRSSIAETRLSQPSSDPARQPLLLAPLSSYGRFALRDRRDPLLALSMLRGAGAIVLAGQAAAGDGSESERELQTRRGVFALQVEAAWKAAHSVATAPPIGHSRD